MKTELEMVRDQHKKLGLPVRDKPQSRAEQSETTSRRRLVRVEVEDFIKYGLYSDDLVELSIRLGRVAFVTAGTLAQFGVEPDIQDFAAAITDSIRDAVRDLDFALRLSSWDDVRKAACRMELIWYGVAANIGIPYHDLLALLHTSYASGMEVDKEAVRALLARAALPVKPAKVPDVPSGDAA